MNGVIQAKLEMDVVMVAMTMTMTKKLLTVVVRHVLQQKKKTLHLMNHIVMNFNLNLDLESNHAGIEKTMIRTQDYILVEMALRKRTGEIATSKLTNFNLF